MKYKIFAASALVLAATTLGACAVKDSEAIISATEKILQTTHSLTAQATTLAAEVPTLTELVTQLSTTTQAPITTAAPKTTRAPQTTKAPKTTKAPATTRPFVISTTSAGRVYKKEAIEAIELKYGVKEHKYKTVYFQDINGESVEVGYEYTNTFINRRSYSATYEELLPGARDNREKYRSYINENLRIINSYRAEKGIAPLKLDEELTVVACVRAEEIAWSGKHSHRRPNGKSGLTIFKDAGFETGMAGENLGYVFDSPEDVCQAWKESDSHYENLMNPDFVKIGIGVAADPDKNGKLCWVNLFLSA